MKLTRLFCTVATIILPTQLQASTPASSHVIFVDKVEDSREGVCVADSDQAADCNLRAAVQLASSLDGNSTLVLRSDATVSLGSIAFEPKEVKTLVIRGEGNERANIVGSENSRLLEIGEKASVAIAKVDIAGFAHANEGGAIRNAGILALDESHLVDNSVNCSAIGAMTASATCGGGAIANFGQLTLGDEVLFEANVVTASAATASFTTAYAQGGAIWSPGELILNGKVGFEGNRAIASAQSGMHPSKIGGATAAAFGGAISGAVTVSSQGREKAIFRQNEVEATGSSPFGDVATENQGGAVATPRATDLEELSLMNFEGNLAPEGIADVFVHSAD